MNFNCRIWFYFGGNEHGQNKWTYLLSPLWFTSAAENNSWVSFPEAWPSFPHLSYFIFDTLGWKRFLVQFWYRTSVAPVLFWTRPFPWVEFVLQTPIFLLLVCGKLFELPKNITLRVINMGRTRNETVSSSDCGHSFWSIFVARINSWVSFQMKYDHLSYYGALARADWPTFCWRPWYFLTVDCTTW